MDHARLKVLFKKSLVGIHTYTAICPSLLVSLIDFISFNLILVRFYLVL